MFAVTGCDSDTSPGRQRGLSDVSDSLCRRLARNWIRSHCTSAGNRRRSSYLMSGAVGQGFFSNGSVWRKAGTRNACLYPQCPPPSLQPPSGFECMLSGNARHQRTCRQMSHRRQPPPSASGLAFAISAALPSDESATTPVSSSWTFLIKSVVYLNLNRVLTTV